MTMVANYTFPELKGRCLKCVLASNVSVYMRASPVCLFDYEGQTYNIAEDVEKDTCFSEDPRLQEDIVCKTLVSNDTWTCLRGCWGSPEIKERQTVALGPDRYCSYKINFDYKDDPEPRKLLFEYTG